MTVLNGLEAVNNKVNYSVKPVFALTEEPRTFQGYINGYRQPVALMKIRIFALHHQIAGLQKALHHYFKNYHFTEPPQSSLEIADYFAKIIGLVHNKCGFPIFEDSQITSHPNNEFSVWIPMLFAPCFHSIAALIIKLFNYHLLQTDFVAEEKLATELTILIDTLKMHAPQGLNRLPLLKVAFDLNVPWRHLVNNTFQYGYGKHSRWLDSTFTDTTRHIPTVFAESKRTIAYLLTQAGFPVTEPYSVNNELEALAVADKLGYPVVIKPSDRCGGLGVFPNLLSRDAVKKAFHKARQHTNTVLLEKHINGKDYRVVLINGKILCAIERIPAGIIGDGAHTIEILVEKHNQHYQPINPLRLIQITEETTDYLTQQGYRLNTIPLKGQFIALQRISNISAGGLPVAVTEKMHPDNQQLMEAAAKLLRLDFIGIDFIIADIEQSYREVGGKIIEVNVQPQLGATAIPDIYHQIIAKLISKQGRIPIIVVCGKNYLLSPLQNQLGQHHKKVGLANNDGALVNGQLIVNTPSLFIAGQHLLSLDDLDALIYHVTDYRDIESQGLPFDCYDQLFLLDTIRHDNNLVLPTLFKACCGETVILESVFNGLKDALTSHSLHLIVTEPPIAHKYPGNIKTVSYLDEQRIVVLRTINGNLTTHEISPEILKQDALLTSICDIILN